MNLGGYLLPVKVAIWVFAGVIPDDHPCVFSLNNLKSMS